MYADDMADACVFLMQTCSGNDFVNIGTGEDITVRELTKMVALTVGYKGDILWDATKPDGTQQKLLVVSRLQNAFAIWESARSMLQAHLSHTHREWTPERVRREVAHRMSHGAV